MPIRTGGKVSLTDQDYQDAAGKYLILKIDVDQNGQAVGVSRTIIRKDV